MVFSSLTFLYLFLPAVLLLYFLAPAGFRNAILLTASLVFYFCGEQIYLLLMLGEILVTYAFGRIMEYSTRGKKLLLIVFLIISFGLLGLFKYADLIPETVNTIAGKEHLKLLRLPLPIGISFYVFQSVSYGVDVYRGKYPPEKNLLNLALYVSFFPQLIAGPIVRFESVSENLKHRTYGMERLGNGLFRFSLGLGKKVLIADRLYAFCDAASSTGEPTVLIAWAEALAFLLYVYFDFSGYSDMAIGLAQAFGFDLPENFNYPLISKSFREFWRRWHISLGSWFRDYLYIPLGGSRKGFSKHLVNLLIVWACTGLWHGASWNFVLWGLSFGILLMYEVIKEKIAGEKAGTEKNSSGPGNIGLSVLKTMLVITVTAMLFVWFRFTDLSAAIDQFKKMFGSVPIMNSDTVYLLKGAALLFAIALPGATPLPARLAGKLSRSKIGPVSVPVFKSVMIVFILVFATAYLVDGSFSPFLYFRF